MLNLFKPPIPTIGILIFFLIFLKPDNIILEVFSLVSVLKMLRKQHNLHLNFVIL